MRALPFVCLLAVLPAAAQGAAKAEAPPVDRPSSDRLAREGRRDPYAGMSESDALATLRALEAQLSLGQAPPPTDIERAIAAATGSPYVPVRALAVSVLAWLDPSVATDPLLLAANDEEPRVRAGAALSLLSLARRLIAEERRRVVADALAHLDDPVNEVACAAVELLGALAPSAAADAVRTRADAADDVRYACFARVGGLPPRAVQLPPLSEPPTAPPKDAIQPEVLPAPPRADGTWLLVATAASVGLVAGALVPSGFVPSRDVLTYDDDSSRITREEVALLSQLGAGLLGAAALGGGAWALAQATPIEMDEAGAVVIAVASLGLAGASAPLALGLSDGPAAFVTAGGLALGLAGGTGLALGFALDVDDEVLAASSMVLGGVGAGLIVFTATPVGDAEVGAAKRTDFGLGIAGVGAGVAGFTALAAGALFDVSAARSFAVLAGGVVGAGVATATGFALVPPSDVESRIACGIGIGGLVVGMVGGMLVPEAWLPSARIGPAVVIEEGKLTLGVPVISPLPARPGRTGGLGATIVYARF